jgi:RimJ/RimL family protein N-acetyltransferase
MTDEVTLREVTQEDVLVFFEYQLDPEAARMAAVPTRDRDTYVAHWAKILANDTGIARTIVWNGQVAGDLLCWQEGDLRLVGYWLGRAFWGKGIATRALAEFLRIQPARPLHAYVAKHNGGSIRVLERCGFVVVGEGTPHGPPGEVIEELTMRLDAGGATAAR